MSNRNLCDLSLEPNIQSDNVGIKGKRVAHYVGVKVVYIIISLNKGRIIHHSQSRIHI